MENNNNTGNIRQGDGGYSFPQNEEQFQNVLRQAQEGQFRKETPDFSQMIDGGGRRVNGGNTNGGGDVKGVNENAYGNAGSVGNTYSAERDERFEGRVHYSAENFSPEKDFYGFGEPVYSGSLTPVKKRVNPLAIIIPMVLAVIAAAVVFFILLNNTVSYRKAEENYFGGLSTALFEKYAEASGENGASAPKKTEIKVSVPAAELANMDFSEFSLVADSAVSGETVYGTLEAALGELRLSSKIWTDRENLTCVMFLPEISELYLYFNPETEEKSPKDLEGIYNDVYKGLSDLYFELAGDPKVEKNVEFSVDGNVFKADRYIVRLDGAAIAKLLKGTLDTLLENEAAAEAICDNLGYENKAELLESDYYKDMIKELEDIISGAESSGNSFLMTVYVKNKTVIGREIVLTDADSEGSENGGASLAVMSDGGVRDAADITDSFNEKVYLNIYEIPTEKGQLTHIYFKSLKNSFDYTGGKKLITEEMYLTCDDKISGKKGEIHSGTLICGVTYSDGGSEAITAEYSELAVTEELFQGDISVSAANQPALSMSARLSIEGDDRVFELTVPNILTANVTISPSEAEFKEAPALIEGGYVEFPGKEENKSAAEKEAEEKFQEDFISFVYKLMGIEPYYGDGSIVHKNDASDFPEKEPEKDGRGDSTALAPVGDGGASEKDTVKENLFESATAAPSETVETEKEEETSAAQTAVTAPNQKEERESSVPEAVPTLSEIDTGDAQKVTGGQIDGFNSGNYYKTEIYVDGEGDVSENVSVSELKGVFDGYVKGKVLQVDFAEGYEFDSALIVLTFPWETVSGGRNYPQSEALKGINRYMVMGAEEGEEYGDREIECYRYSERQLGFIAEKSGYYYVVDLDGFFHDVMGINPDETGNG